MLPRTLVKQTQSPDSFRGSSCHLALETVPLVCASNGTIFLCDSIPLVTIGEMQQRPQRGGVGLSVYGEMSTDSHPVLAPWGLFTSGARYRWRNEAGRDR